MVLKRRVGTVEPDYSVDSLDDAVTIIGGLLRTTAEERVHDSLAALRTTKAPSVNRHFGKNMEGTECRAQER